MSSPHLVETFSCQNAIIIINTIMSNLHFSNSKSIILVGKQKWIKKSILWSVSLVNEAYLTVESNHLWEPPWSPSSLSQGVRASFLPPLPPPAAWMAQMLLDGTVPAVPCPSLIAQHELPNLFSDDCFLLEQNFSLVQGTKAPKEEGDEEEGRLADTPVSTR